MKKINKLIYYSFFWIIHYIIDSIFIIFKKLIFKKINDKNKICVVKVDKIGDFILWISAAKNLKSSSNNKKIVLIVNEINFNIAKYLNIFDEIIPINIKKYTRNIFYRININQILIRKNYYTIYHPTFSRFFSTGDSLVRISTSPNKIGFYGDKFNQSSLQNRISNNWYSKLININKDSKMMLEFHSDFIQQTYNSHYLNKASIINHKIKKDFHIKDRFFVCTPFSSLKAKDWSVDNYVRLINSICKNNNLTVVLSGSKHDELNIKKLANSLSVKSICLFEHNILNLFDLLSHAKFLIGSDSGPAHIAILLGKKTFIIEGFKKISEQFFPYLTSKDTNIVFPTVIKSSDNSAKNKLVTPSYALKIIQNEIK